MGLSLLGCTPPSDTSDTSIDSAFDSTVPQLEYKSEQTGPLSYRVNFFTDEDTFARAKYYQDGTRDLYEIHSSPNLQGEHTIDILGLRPGQVYNVMLEATDSEGEVVGTRAFSLETNPTLPLSKKLPEEFVSVPVITEVWMNPEKVNPEELVLANILFKDQYNIPYGVIFDRTGQPVWLHLFTEEYSGATGDHVISFSENNGDFTSNNQGRVLLMGGGIPNRTRAVEFGLDHVVTKELTQQAAIIGSTNYFHHNYHRLADGSYFMSTGICLGPSECYDRLVIHDGDFDPEVNVDNPEEGILWQANMRHLTMEQDFNYFINSVIVDQVRNRIYYNSYDFQKGMLYAFDITGDEQIPLDIAWVFGHGIQKYDWSERPGVVTIDNFVAGHEADLADPYFYHPHGVKVYHQEGDAEDELRVLLHDNGGHLDEIARAWTLFREYRINTVSGEAEIMWTYPRMEDLENGALKYSNPIFGDIDKVGDNRFMVYSGSVWDSKWEVDEKTVIMELEVNYETRSAEPVWTMTMEHIEDYENDDERGTERFRPSVYAGELVTGMRGVVYEEELQSHYFNELEWGNEEDYSGYWSHLE